VLIIRTENLEKYYGKNGAMVKAVDCVNMEIEEGTTNAIVGASGSGKSSLLNLLGGIDIPTEGRVLINDTDIFNMKKDKLTIFRRNNIGFIFQAYNLIPVLNAYENIILPLKLEGKKVNTKSIEELMQVLDIWGRKNHMPGALSGGEQQRVAIARALAVDPKIILADEPTGNLDTKNSEAVMQLLISSVEHYGKTLIIITHDEKIATMEDRIYKMKDGKLYD